MSILFYCHLDAPKLLGRQQLAVSVQSKHFKGSMVAISLQALAKSLVVHFGLQPLFFLVLL